MTGAWNRASTARALWYFAIVIQVRCRGGSNFIWNTVSILRVRLP